MVPADYWPEYLGKTLGRRTVNLAMRGSSNQRILRTTLDYLFTAKEPIEHIIIGWSSPDRAELPRAQGGYYLVTALRTFSFEPEPHGTSSSILQSIYYQHCHNEQASIAAFLQAALIMQAVCRERGIALLNFQSFYDNFQSIGTQWPELTALQQQLDTTQWISGTMDSALSQYPRLPSQHPTDQGNERWAEIIAEHLAK
jgi:hypothetical protein